MINQWKEAFVFGLLALITGLLSSRVVIEPCTVLSIQAQNDCITHKNVTMDGCCDDWCMVKTCEKTTYYMDCMIKYVHINRCCEGYNGSECRPVCDGGCGPNEICVEPNNCTCADGWSGKNCQQVSGLMAFAVKANSISVSWDMAVNSSVINNYYIYVEYDEQMVYNTTTVGVINQTTIQDLVPNTQYRVCVIPIILDGTGTENCIDVWTAEAAPSTPPLNVTILRLSPLVILVQWLPPSDPNGVVTTYKLYYTTQTDTFVLSVGGQFTIHVEGMEDVIGVNVSALTAAGEGPQSQNVQIETDKEIQMKDVSSLPDNVTTSLISSSDALVQLSWKPSLLNVMDGSVSFYWLRVSSAFNTTVQWALRPHQSLEHTLIDLVPYIQYNFAIYYGTDTGDLGLLYNESFYFKEGVPVAYPSNFTATRLTQDTIKASWNHLVSSKARGTITNYTVEYSKGWDNSCIYTYDTRHMITVDNTVTLWPVDISSVYCVTVTASTSVGSGPVTAPVLVAIDNYGSVNLQLFGVDSCDQWTGNYSCVNDRLIDIRREIIRVLNSNCSCILSDSHFFDENFKCTQSQLSYTVNIVGTETTPSSELLTVVDAWVSGQPTFVIQGISIIASNGESPSPESTCNNDTSYIIATFVLSVVVLFCLIGWIITCCVCWKLKTELKQFTEEKKASYSANNLSLESIGKI